ncbi:hypothetical protein ACWFRB_08320 [Rhodococcus sp. NPDC055112]
MRTVPRGVVIATPSLTRRVCDCHIGYAPAEQLPLYDVFAGVVPERIPSEPVWLPFPARR